MALRTVGLLLNFKRTLIELRGLGIVALSPINQPEVVQRGANQGMTRTQSFLPDRQGTHVKCFGSDEVAPSILDEPQIIKDLGHLRVIGPENLLAECQGL